MLFNSIEFIAFFLPFVLVAYFALQKYAPVKFAIGFLVFSSLVFYGWWKPVYLLLLIFSLLVNFFLSQTILNLNQRQTDRHKALAKWTMIGGVVLNLGLIGYFKYTDFLIDTLNQLSGANVGFLDLILPLGISFFTFQQVAYLVDTYRGITTEHRFSYYCLFVTFFPQLIAGPIVHHSSVMPQFERESTFRFDINNLSVGLFIFKTGLAKKVLLADSISDFSTPIFGAVDRGESVTTVEAWAGALAYSLQLYFDFSGYSDMAIGLGMMFGIRLPVNFNSPYKSINIIEFWRRWHMTLSQFLRDYVYIPLGGNRKGTLSRYNNLMITMLVGGLWHGAGWNFIIWGGLHGFYLICNHGWQNASKKLPTVCNVFRFRPVSIFITFIAVVLAWVFFRAETFSGAGVMLTAMLGVEGVSFPVALEVTLNQMGKHDLISLLNSFGVVISPDPSIIRTKDWFSSGVPLIGVLLFVAFFMPNSLDMLRKSNLIQGPDWIISGSVLNGTKGRAMALATGVVFFVSLMTMMTTKQSEFLYFNF